MKKNYCTVVHIITSTEIGGAEVSLLNLVDGINSKYFNQLVISLAPSGQIAKKINSLGVEVISLGMKSGKFKLNDFQTLVKILKQHSPDIVHCWMYHANVLGGITARILKIPTIWSIHHDMTIKSKLKIHTRFIVYFGAILSKLVPDRIIFCSNSSKETHKTIGYYQKNAIVINNGFDTAHFNHDNSSGRYLKEIHSISNEVFVIGQASRYHPTKDHYTFIKACTELKKLCPEVHFLMCGKGVDKSNPKLEVWINEGEIRENTTLLGEFDDMRSFYSAIDIYCQSSVSEALPNSIGEAMSCEVPCVATNVGDTFHLIKNTGLVVPPSQPKAIAKAIHKIVVDNTLRKEIGAAARKRIVDYFGKDQFIKSHENLYSLLLRSN